MLIKVLINLRRKRKMQNFNHGQVFFFVFFFNGCIYCVYGYLLEKDFNDDIESTMKDVRKAV